MSDTEKKGSVWPWILVPLAAVTVFVVLREYRSRFPSPEASSEAAAPAVPDVPAAEPVAPPAPAEPAPAAPAAAEAAASPPPQ
jgi:hypothetical protein